MNASLRITAHIRLDASKRTVSLQETASLPLINRAILLLNICQLKIHPARPLIGHSINRPRPAMSEHLLRRAVLKTQQTRLLLHRNERAVQALVVERAETGAEAA